MSDSKPVDPVLKVQLRGPSVDQGRVALVDLSKLARLIQTGVDRVARVLSGETTSSRRGPTPKHIRETCVLEVVALERGSFMLALDLRRDQPLLPGQDLGEDALEKFVGGLRQLGGESMAVPSGYDEGVLSVWREMGELFAHGIDRIDFRMRHGATSFDRALQERVIERIREPLQNRRTVEGRLLMADFRKDRFKCRLHPPGASPIECEFDEQIADTVYQHLRSYVRMTGEAIEDSATGEIKTLRVADVEALELPAGDEILSPDEFWREPSLEELAVEQGVTAPQSLARVIGAAAELWQSDADLEAFLAGVHQTPDADGGAEK